METLGRGNEESRNLQVEKRQESTKESSDPSYFFLTPDAEWICRGACLLKLGSRGQGAALVVAHALPRPVEFGRYDAYEALLLLRIGEAKGRSGTFCIKLRARPGSQRWKGAAHFKMPVEFAESDVSVRLIVRPVDLETGVSGRPLLRGNMP